MAGFMKLQVWREPMTLRFDPEAGEPRFVPQSEAHGYDDLPPEVTADGYAEPNIGGEGSTAYFARYSAPGYMDRTDTTGPWPTAVEALCSAFETYASDDDEDDANEAIEVAASLGIDTAELRLCLGLT